MQSKINGAQILITGANGGMGIETIKLLLKEKPKKVVMACRSLEKALEARTKVEPFNLGIELVALGGFDMNKYSSIKTAVDSLVKQDPFDIIFLQAGGVIFSDRYEFVNHNGRSIEKTVYQNAFGAYLSFKFLDEQNLVAKDARIVYAGGEGARGIKGLIEKPNFKSFEELENYLHNGGEKYLPMNAIGVSKMVSALLSIKSAEQHENRSFVWFSPGLTSGTNGLNGMKGVRKLLLKHIAFPLFTMLGQAQNPQKAAVKYVDCLAGRIGENGDIIGAPEGKAIGKLVDQKPMNSAFTNHHLRNRLFAYANSL